MKWRIDTLTLLPFENSEVLFVGSVQAVDDAVWDDAGAHPSFYCKRSVYEHFGAFDTSYRIAADFENLLRLIFVHRIKTLYVPKDFVTMRTGGASTAGFTSRKQIMREHLKAMKKNGVYSNVILLSLRYFYKIYEVLRGGKGMKG